jgi:hypothetical protein
MGLTAKIVQIKGLFAKTSLETEKAPAVAGAFLITVLIVQN